MHVKTVLKSYLYVLLQKPLSTKIPIYKMFYFNKLLRTFLLFPLIVCAFFIVSCNSNVNKNENTIKVAKLDFGLVEAQKIIALPMHCLTVEYPNKLGQVLHNEEELKSPKELRPIFYGCFDWHSSAHGYWSVIKLVKQFPELDSDNKIHSLLEEVFTEEHVAIEAAFFKQPLNRNFERTYGWAWFLDRKSTRLNSSHV